MCNVELPFTLITPGTTAFKILVCSLSTYILSPYVIVKLDKHEYMGFNHEAP